MSSDLRTSNAQSLPGLSARLALGFGSLQAAADTGELEMWLQPKQRLCAPEPDAIDGFEALVRWRHPQWGFRSAGRVRAFC